MTDFLATLSPSLSLLRAHLYVGVAHITVREGSYADGTKGLCPLGNPQGRFAP